MSIREITDAELANIESCGRVGFDYKQIAAMLEVPIDDVAIEFQSEQGQVYNAWHKGRMQAELDLRNSMMKEAIGGNTAMVQKMLDIFHNTDEQHRKLIY